MANKKPFHQSVIIQLNELSIGDWDRACALLDLIAVTKVPDGEGDNLVATAINTAIRMNDDDTNTSAVAVIVAYDGRGILQERFLVAEDESGAGGTLRELVDKFNKTGIVESIEIPGETDSEDTEEGRAEFGRIVDAAQIEIDQNLEDLKVEGATERFAKEFGA